MANRRQFLGSGKGMALQFHPRGTRSRKNRQNIPLRTDRKCLRPARGSQSNGPTDFRDRVSLPNFHRLTTTAGIPNGRTEGQTLASLSRVDEIGKRRVQPGAQYRNSRKLEEGMDYDETQGGLLLLASQRLPPREG